MTERKHSELPWSRKKLPLKPNRFFMVDSKGEKYLGVLTNVADGEFIVRACNSHYELVEALERFYKTAVHREEFKNQSTKGLDWARDLLKKAKGETQ